MECSWCTLHCGISAAGAGFSPVGQFLTLLLLHETQLSQLVCCCSVPTAEWSTMWTGLAFWQIPCLTWFRLMKTHPVVAMLKSRNTGLSLDNLFFLRPDTKDMHNADKELKNWYLDRVPAVSEIPSTQDLQKELENFKTLEQEETGNSKFRKTLFKMPKHLSEHVEYHASSSEIVLDTISTTSIQNMGVKLLKNSPCKEMTRYSSFNQLNVQNFDSGDKNTIQNAPLFPAASLSISVPASEEAFGLLRPVTEIRILFLKILVEVKSV
ncbi:uncharacterized protein LOC115472448 [Microcaecilia unicolor]|uniref:Uncharacterized protein LOC115472448 n=1 Tax=Microcaecilia unicolor TaxID=1415580 RepID=A0A6P7YCE0_9AMPH|nr:uncharacterized protein LOC115472448 [Microcaecilia unicolor]